MNAPEIVRPSHGLRIVSRPHPFSTETYQIEFPHGLTIRAIVGENAVAVCVEIGGERVPERMWPHIRPKVGVVVAITRFPQGGSAKTIFRLIAFAALAVGVAILSGGAGFGFVTAIGNFINLSSAVTAGLLAAGLGLVGSLAINALIPPSTPNSAASASTQLLNSITGTSNQVTRYGPIPCILGTVLYFPTYAAMPYTEASGDDQYLRCLFDLGYGSPGITNLKIGDTDLADYTDVETEIGVNPALFSQDILEEAVGAEMDTDGSVVTRTTGAGADEIGFDYVFPSGLFGVDSNGNVTFTQNFTQVDISPTGAGTWTTIIASQPGLTISTPATDCWVDGGYSTFRTSNSERKALRIGIRFKVTKGQYDVRLTRVNTNYGGAPSGSQVGAMQWTVLRTIRYSSVSNTGTLKLAMRIKATDQLSGNISQFNCIASQQVPAWHPDTQTWVTEYTSNPAWLFRWMLRDSPANPRRVDPLKIDDVELIAWGAECGAKGSSYSKSLASTTLYALLKEIAAAGRASFAIRDGKYSVIRDLEQTTPVQVFTPRNSSGFAGNRAFPDPVNALRVQFVNPSANYQQDERVVYDDGYGDAAMVAADPTLTLATQYEELTLAGCDSPEAAWRLGRYHLAVARMRPNTYTLSADVESLVCNRGDLILAASDVISVGLGWGRVKAAVVDGSGNTIAIQTDEAVTGEAGNSYAVRIRLQDGSVVYPHLNLPEYGTGLKYLPFATPVAGVAGVPAINPGDLFAFGILGQDTIPLVVTKIEPSADFAAKISGVDAAPIVLQADAGTPPVWTSQITGQGQLQTPPEPAVVVIDSSQLLSITDDSGNTAPTMIVTANSQFSGTVAVDHAQVRYRRSDTVGAWTTIDLPQHQQSVAIDGGFDRGAAYQVEVRNIGVNGAASAWVQATHTVATVSIAPIAPSDFGANSLPTGVNLHWTISGTQRADVQYDIQRTDDVSGAADAAGWAIFDSTQSTSYLDSETDNVFRWYRVRASDYGGLVTDWSAAVKQKSRYTSGGEPGA